MVPYLQSASYFDDDSQELWEDGERVFRRGSRSDVKGKTRAVLIVQPAVGASVAFNPRPPHP